MIAITGATGFLGQHLVRELQTKGVEFTCLVRADSKRLPALQSLQAPLHFVNFNQEASIESGLLSCDTLIHIMGLINGTEEELERINIGYTCNIMNAARRAGIRKVIFISSVAATRCHGFYGETKAKAEVLVRESGILYTIFRPAYIYGPGDENNTALMIRTLKRFPLIPLLGGGDFKLQPVYVGNVVSLIIQAIYKPAANKEYNVAGPAQVSLKQILKKLSEGLKVNRIFVPIPLKPVQFLLRIYLFLFPKTKLPAKQILELDKHEAFDISETSRDFDFNPITFDDGVQKMFEELVCAG